MARNLMPADEVFERTFLETRCKLLEIAANLDRMDRAPSRDRVVNDPRLVKLKKALALLQEGLGTGNGKSDRAEQLQLLFSREYDADWPIEFGVNPVIQEDG